MALDKEQSINDFWGYSLAVYQSDKIQTLCLQLQDEIDADVNLILFAAWLAKQKIHFTSVRVRQACEKTTQWQEGVIKPLRSVRLKVKAISNQKSFYEKIKSVELAAEFESQLRLYLLSSYWQAEKNTINVANNLNNYILSLGKVEEKLKYKNIINHLTDLLNEENKKLSI